MKSNIGPELKLVIQMNIENSRTSSWSLKTLVIFRAEMCWINLIFCPCYCQSYQALLEMSWLYIYHTYGNHIWQTSPILSIIQSFWKLSNIFKRNKIVKGLTFHNLLQRKMAKYLLKRNQLIAIIVVNITC